MHNGEWYGILEFNVPLNTVYGENNGELITEKISKNIQHKEN